MVYKFLLFGLRVICLIMMFEIVVPKFIQFVLVFARCEMN